MKEIKCSFCGKSETKARVILADKNVCICGECVDLAVLVMTEKGFSNHVYRDKYRYMWE